MLPDDALPDKADLPPPHRCEECRDKDYTPTLEAAVICQQSIATGSFATSQASCSILPPLEAATAVMSTQPWTDIVTGDGTGLKSIGWRAEVTIWIATPTLTDWVRANRTSPLAPFIPQIVAVAVRALNTSGDMRSMPWEIWMMAVWTEFLTTNPQEKQMQKTWHSCCKQTEEQEAPWSDICYQEH